MILREMPATWDPAFRPWFYAHWGRENCVIGARTREAEYVPYRQRLSIKAAWGGREDYFLDGRRLTVDDDTFLILNDGRTYSSSLRSDSPVTSFSVFFRPGMAEEVFKVMERPAARLLDDPGESRARVEFSEHLRAHDPQVTPILRFILRHVLAGVTDENWYEEQLYFLLQRMHSLHARDRADMSHISATRARTRRELHRRIGLAVNFINTHFASHIGLSDIAAAALLSRFHCLRVFKEVYGTTPMAYLNERRVKVALRLLRSGTHSVSDVAALVGFQSRTTLFRNVKRTCGTAPRAAHLQALRQPG